LLDRGDALNVQINAWLTVAACLGAAWLIGDRAYKLCRSITYRTMDSPDGLARRCLTVSAVACLPLIVTCAVTCVFCWYVAHRSLASIGLILIPDYSAQFGLFAATALSAATLCVVVGYLLGWIRAMPSRMRTDPSRGIPAFCSGLTYTFAGSILEEVVLRGFALSILCDASGPVAALLVTSGVFSISHLLSCKKLPPLYLANAFLFGVVAGYCRLATGALWAPIGLHIGWNLPTTSVFGLPMCGSPNHRGLMECEVRGPSLVTGGAYSPSGGALGSLELGAVALALAVLGVPF